MNPVRSSPDKHDLAKSSVQFVWTDACFYCLARYQVKIISSRLWTVALTIVIVKGEPSSQEPSSSPHGKCAPSCRGHPGCRLPTFSFQVPGAP